MASQETVGPADEPVKGVAADSDWRTAVGQRPLAWSLGALGVGLLTGCAVSDACKRPKGNRYRRRSAPARSLAQAPRPLTDEHRSAKTPATRPEPDEEVASSAAPDPLRQELENLRNRFIAELSMIAHQVLLPAVISGLREALVSDQRAARARTVSHDAGKVARLNRER